MTFVNNNVLILINYNKYKMLRTGETGVGYTETVLSL